MEAFESFRISPLKSILEEVKPVPLWCGLGKGTPISVVKVLHDPQAHTHTNGGADCGGAGEASGDRSPRCTNGGADCGVTEAGEPEASGDRGPRCTNGATVQTAA